jgi:hypothetical protein
LQPVGQEGAERPVVFSDKQSHISCPQTHDLARECGRGVLS